MPMGRKQRKSDQVHIIDHEPLAQPADISSSNGLDTARSKAVFGKRVTRSETRNAAYEKDERPFEKNGMSTYFINRVRERQAGDRASAIRNTPVAESSAQTSLNDGQIPYTALAAVFALAVAIPVGFIWLTERAAGPDIDRITTASVSAADGLAVENVNMIRILKNGSFVVTVSGRISNTAVKRKSLMPLTISLVDEDGVEVQSWRHRAGNGIVKPDGSLFFNTSAIDFSGRAQTARVVARTVK